MSKSEKPELAHLLQHHPDAENGFCELCEASSIASVVLPHAMALAERSEISLALMAAELAAQSIEAISHAENVDLDVVLAAVQRKSQGPAYRPGIRRHRFGGTGIIPRSSLRSARHHCCRLVQVRSGRFTMNPGRVASIVGAEF